MNRGPHKNSFDLMRLIFAFFVIITHSYAILGYEEHDLLYRISGGQTKFSVFAVDSFFVISGYLVTISLVNSSSIFSYMSKRVLRIVPGFWAAVLLSIVVLGFLTSETPLESIFSAESIRYVTNNFAFRIHYYVSGILSGKAINGSLWTIPYEAFLYILIIPLWWIRRSTTRVSVVVSVLLGFLALHFLANGVLIDLSLPVIWINIAELCRLGVLYMMGALFATWKIPGFRKNWIVMLLGIGVIGFSFIAHIYYYTAFLCIPAIVISLGLMYNKTASRAAANGDYSYGVYLWAFPIQQAIAYFFDIQEPVYLTLAAMPIAYIFGMMSWHFIEHPFLRLKYLLPVREKTGEAEL